MSKLWKVNAAMLAILIFAVVASTIGVLAALGLVVTFGIMGLLSYWGVP